MKKFFIIFIILMFSVPVFAQDEYEESENYEDDPYGNEDASDLLGEEPIENYDEPSPVEKQKTPEAPKNPNVPGEVNKWQLVLNTSLVNVDHCITAKFTNTVIGLPFSQTSFSAGYQISTQIWLMAKFHLYVNLLNTTPNGQFLLGPGIRADFIRTDHISFFGGAFISIGSIGKTFLFSPEIYAGVEYNVNNYLAVGVITDFAYRIQANNAAIHFINFMLGPQLTIYF